jgi:hypothetical protein
MEKSELEELIKEVLIEEGAISNAAAAIISGQGKEVIKGLTGSVYDNTVGRLLSNIDKKINKNLTAISLVGQGLDIALIEIVQFALETITESNKHVIGSKATKMGFISQRFTSNDEFGEQDNTDEGVDLSDKSGSVSSKDIQHVISKIGLTNSLKIGESIVNTLTNEDVYDMHRIAKATSEHLEGKGGKKVLPPKHQKKPNEGGPLIYNYHSIKFLASKMMLLGPVNAEGKAFYKVLGAYLNEYVDKSQIKALAKEFKFKYSEKSSAANFKSLESIKEKSPEAAKLVKYLKKEITKKLAIAILHEMSDPGAFYVNKFGSLLTSEFKQKLGSTSGKQKEAPEDLDDDNEFDSDEDKKK